MDFPDLTRGTLYIFSLVPQKADRLGVGLEYETFNATCSKHHNFRWHQLPGRRKFKIRNCENQDSIKDYSLNPVDAFVEWGLRVRKQMLQVIREQKIANHFPATYCKHNDDNAVTGNITKMVIIKFRPFSESGSPLFYWYQLSGMIYIG